MTIWIFNALGVQKLKVVFHENTFHLVLFSSFILFNIGRVFSILLSYKFYLSPNYKIFCSPRFPIIKLGMIQRKRIISLIYGDENCFILLIIQKRLDKKNGSTGPVFFLLAQN